MKTLVTGATGFIGAHLVKALVDEGRDVRCFVRKTSNTEKLERLGIELIYGDLLDRQSLEEAVKGVDIIHHLAGEVYSYKVKDLYDTNVYGTKNLLESCVSENIEKFIYLSTVSVVGPNKNRQQLHTENSPCHPITPYGKSKYEAEKLVRKSLADYKIPSVIIRPPTVYGPGGQPEIVTNIIKLVKKRKLFIIGNGESLRNLCYIDNLVQGILLAERSENSRGKIFFISDDAVYTFNQLIQEIAKAEGVDLRRVHLPKCVGSISGLIFSVLVKCFGISFLHIYAVCTMVFDLAFDISKAKKELDFYPRINLQEGVRKTIPYYIGEESG